MLEWRKGIEAAEPRAIRDVSANSPPNGAYGTNGTGSLPPSILSGVAALKGKACPSMCDPRAWRYACEAAAMLIARGFAERALALGWSMLDLFGADPTGNHHADGLAVWLQGRELRAVSDDWAAAISKTGTHFFNRPRDVGAVPLWTLGNGR